MSLQVHRANPQYNPEQTIGPARVIELAGSREQLAQAVAIWGQYALASIATMELTPSGAVVPSCPNIQELRDLILELQDCMRGHVEQREESDAERKERMKKFKDAGYY